MASPFGTHDARPQEQIATSGARVAVEGMSPFWGVRCAGAVGRPAAYDGRVVA